MIFSLISGLLKQGVNKGLILEEDWIYVRNQVLHLLQLESFPEHIDPKEDSIPNLLDQMIDYAVNENIIADVLDEKDILTADIMNCFLSKPSEIKAKFQTYYTESPKAATDYFYELSKNSNYIQMNRINKNISFKVNTEYGDMDITINLSKPEKDPEQIKREKENQSNINYPKCLLCIENEGYGGRIGHPARSNHRIVPIELQDETWYLQYSPYVYYNEHCILLSETHRDMKINLDTFRRLLTFTEKFPHYFMGSNADLPIVGGSILSHDHYQGGNYEFTMPNAEDDFIFQLDAFPTVKTAIIKWPMSVIRLTGERKEELIKAAEFIREKWVYYSDEDAKIQAHTEDTPHNTITPIARKRQDQFELNLVLRNNRTDSTHPMGIFHPHEDVHHIKKENIGLIEVMGLAVLPPRLIDELNEIKDFIVGNTASVTSYHQEWANELKQKYTNLSDTNELDEVMKQELGNKFVKVLKDAGVFKNQADFSRFINHMNS
ncbi:UDP-glucose--hexose-1-phosphate uridylyltransferase [Oceanobacillus sp. 1P07AA]|uniref:UDP-glucose--hexose-1-phosphate uridylyltransferase n=1 Tax=Oceanobacillus sp. 1P07AA TaxID=3132293 RepID=UPI0039A4C683